MIRSFFLALLTATAAWSAEVVEQSVEHAGVKFRVVQLAPERVKVIWKDGQGMPFRSFDRVQAAFAKQGKTVKFVINAGIFEPGGIPSGLHIENSKPAQPLNTADAPGNFFLKPNGVCAMIDGKAFVGTSAEYQHIKKPITWAIQSGPMLLIDGKRHPAFHDGSTSKLHRNGAGVDEKGQLVFAITCPGEVVNFWDFSGLFLKLRCKDALFLDGDISQMAVNPSKPIASNQFGVMFAVAE